MFNLFVLTFDVDWAPDCVMNKIINILFQKKVKSTWFITHQSPETERLMKCSDRFEIGLHPSFFPNSTQGKNENEVMTHLRSISPAAKVLRTHGLVQSSNLLSRVLDTYGIEVDVSLFLPGTPNIQPHFMRYSFEGKKLLRIPFFWEDDTELVDPGRCWDFYHKKYHVHGLKIFNFHPLHVYLNSQTPGAYENLKKEGPLQELDIKTIDSLVNKEKNGVGTLFNSLVEFLAGKQKQSHTISEIAEEWKIKQ